MCSASTKKIIHKTKTNKKTKKKKEKTHTEKPPEKQSAANYRKGEIERQ
jgi:hypothetical protein